MPVTTIYYLPPNLFCRSYGMVSVEEKMDRRTVEDIQAEIRAKKRQKTDTEADAAQ